MSSSTRRALPLLSFSFNKISKLVYTLQWKAPFKPILRGLAMVDSDQKKANITSHKHPFYPHNSVSFFTCPNANLDWGGENIDSAVLYTLAENL